MSRSFTEFACEQHTSLPLVPTPETCKGATYIVTGSNVGLGLEAARHLSALGAARVILAVRNTRAGEAAKAEIEASTTTSGILEVWTLDLSSFDSVKAFAKRVTEQLDRIDGVIENAGVALLNFSLTEGHESTITINVLSTFLLAVLLLPKLKQSAKQFGILPHLTIVASETGFFPESKTELDKVKASPLQNMSNEALANMMSRYPLSKLVQILTVRYLAALQPVASTGVVINVVNPGLCKTTLNRNASFYYKLMVEGAKLLFGRTAEQGSRTLLHGAVAGKDSHGCYLSVCEIRENKVPNWVFEEEGKQIQKRLWEDIAKELDHVAPGCIENML